MNIETVTEYGDMLGVENCLRFYERQFITRQDANRDILTRFEALLGITPNEWRGQLPCVNGTSTISEGSELPTGLSNESLKA